jgi:phage N-6-adenine-methyltransferase
MSKNTTWITPQWIIDAIGLSDLDPCGYKLDGKPIVETAHNYYTLEDKQNGLIDPWHGSIYCNPPYNNTHRWFIKCREYHQQTGEDVIILMKNIVERIFFQDEISNITGIVFIRDRVAFLNSEGKKQSKAMYGSILVAFGEGAWERIQKVAGIAMYVGPDNPSN